MQLKLDRMANKTVMIFLIWIILSLVTSSANISQCQTNLTVDNFKKWDLGGRK